MKINVKARPGAREEKVEKIDEQNFVVSVKEPPVQGKANTAINSDERIESVETLITEKDLLDNSILLRQGKKNYIRVLLS